MMPQFLQIALFCISVFLLTGMFRGAFAAEIYRSGASAETSVAAVQNHAGQGSLAERAVRDGWKIELIDTAGNHDYLDVVEKEVILALNMVRTDPERYAALYIREIIAEYRGKSRRFRGGITVETAEGSSPAEELYRELMHRAPLPVLVPSRGLYCSADDLAHDQSLTGKTGHTGSDGRNLDERIGNCGHWQTAIGETIAYGGSTGFEIVNDLLIDDGVRGRGHRKIILDAAYRAVGVSVRKHPVYGSVSVIEYAGSFTELDETFR